MHCCTLWDSGVLVLLFMTSVSYLRLWYVAIIYVFVVNENQLCARVCVQVLRFMANTVYI